VLQRFCPSAKELWLKVLPPLFLLMQYPASAAALIAWNRTRPASSQPLKQPRIHRLARRLVGLLHALWAFAMLSVTLVLVDVAAVFILLASSAAAATHGLSRKDPLWWLALPLHCLPYARSFALDKLLPALRWLCLSCNGHGPGTLLQPNRTRDGGNSGLLPAAGGEEVWAENHMFARMPMEALLEALPQMLLQTLTFFLGPDQKDSEQPVLLLFMLSVTLSSISIGKSIFYIRKAGVTVGLSSVESFMLLMQLQGTFRVPAGLINAHKSIKTDDRLTVRLPPASENLTPLQAAGFISAHLAAYERHRALHRYPPSRKWTLQILNVHHTPLAIRYGQGRCAQLLMEQILHGASKQQLTGLKEVDIR
jgi:hypothetical protein